MSVDSAGALGKPQSLANQWTRWAGVFGNTPPNNGGSFIGLKPWARPTIWRNSGLAGLGTVNMRGSGITRD